MVHPAVDALTAMMIAAVVEGTVDMVAVAVGAAMMTHIAGLDMMTALLAHMDVVTTTALEALIAMHLDEMTATAAVETTIVVVTITVGAMVVVGTEMHLQGILAIRTEVENPTIPLTIGTPVVRSCR